MKTRILSAIIMLAIFVPILIFGKLPFLILSILLAVLSLYELIKAKTKEKKTPVMLRIISYIFLALLIYLNKDYDTNYQISNKVFPFLFGTLLLPVVFINNNDKYNISDALYLIGNILFLGFCFSSFIIIRNIDLFIFIYLILITTITDTFALITGSLIGKRKLCEKISPKKTIEGSIGGSIVGTIISSIFYMMIINPNANVTIVILITFLLTIVGQLGDLFFSSIKRHYDIKDFSKLIPGHGGILDRLDSILFVIITYMLFINIL